jgi:hypothetical protein
MPLSYIWILVGMHLVILIIIELHELENVTGNECEDEDIEINIPEILHGSEFNTCQLVMHKVDK